MWHVYTEVPGEQQGDAEEEQDPQQGRSLGHGAKVDQGWEAKRGQCKQPDAGSMGPDERRGHIPDMVVPARPV